ncbi:hemagglutinin protein, partial [Flavobacteriaceae bacterium LYZ1037]
MSIGQTIEKFSIDSGGASATAGGIEILYTIGEVNVQELSAGNIQVSEGFINGSMKIKIDPKVFLQGPLLNPVNAGLMNDNLRSSNYIPTTSPYADAATCDVS